MQCCMAFSQGLLSFLIHFDILLSLLYKFKYSRSQFKIKKIYFRMDLD